MSPEQAIDSTGIDCRTDIYSLGATLYHLLVGGPPYQASTMMAVLLKHRDAPIPSLVESRRDIPPSLDAIYRRMVAKEPRDRYQTTAELVRALEAEADGMASAGAAPAGLSPATVMVKRASSLQASSVPETSRMAPSLTVNQPRPSAADVAALKVVLVEPSRTQSAIIRKYLQAQGIKQVVSVPSGREALEAVNSAVPDVMVSALHLPDMTGTQLAQQIRAAGNAARIGFVLISSEAEKADAGSLSNCGKAMLLQKPFTPEQLAEALSLVAGRSTVKKPPTGDKRGGLRVLIVDDSLAARVHIRSVLGQLGLSKFAEAPDGAQAVALAAREAFDLIVTDYNMPFMDGQGLVGYLKQNPATALVPIIMVTSETDPAKLDAVRRLGVAAICDKAFRPEEVEKVIEQVLKNP
jgi:two-component system chemotaxis response regulator CheY